MRKIYVILVVHCMTLLSGLREAITTKTWKKRIFLESSRKLANGLLMNLNKRQGRIQDFKLGGAL